MHGEKMVRRGKFQMIQLQDAFIQLLEKAGFTSTELVMELNLARIPHHWELFHDMALLPSSSFRSDFCASLGERLWRMVADVFKVSRVGRQSSIKNDNFRSPQLEMLLGTDTWVRRVDNGVIYELDIAKTMFSSGNITEKIRMGRLECRGETVVDLFAGIGYFTVPILRAGAEMVYACEWSPFAREALSRNCRLNRVADRCEVLFGDNREVAPVGVADRVLLGLIPSSEPFWTTACRCLKREFGGILHVHMNVASKTEFIAPSWNSVNSVLPGVKFHKPAFEAEGFRIVAELTKICNSLTGSCWQGLLVHFERVKSYGPNIFHCVFDISLRPVLTETSGSSDNIDVLGCGV